MRMDVRRKRLIESRQAGKVGRRYYAFYLGFKARRTSQPGNPYKAGSEDHTSWQAGWEYADPEQSKTQPPLCQFGPGGDFVTDWPEETQ